MQPAASTFHDVENCATVTPERHPPRRYELRMVQQLGIDVSYAQDVGQNVIR
jgi:hypothetical protein